MRKIMLLFFSCIVCSCTYKTTQTNPILTSTFRKESGKISYTKEEQECFNKGIFGSNTNVSVVDIAKKGNITEIVSVDDYIIVYPLSLKQCIIVKGN